MARVLKLQDYLKNRQIAPVFDRLQECEKNSEIALKFMCVIDYDLIKANLYDRIQATNQPKLLTQLLGFETYKSFVYYDYQGNASLDSIKLKCKKCEIVGPYALILTHMAINHGIHMSFKMCMYCCKLDLKDHLDNDSLKECYDKYLKREENTDIVVYDAVQKIILDFYNALKNRTKDFGAYSKRQYNYYLGRGVSKAETLPKNYRGISDQTTVYQPRVRAKPISYEKLDKTFERAMDELWGANGFHRSMTPVEVNIQSESSDDEMGSYDFANFAQPSTSGIWTSRACSLNDHQLNSSTPAPSISAMSTQSVCTPQPSVSDNWFLQMVRDRHSQILDRATRRDIEYVILKAFDNIEDKVNT